MVNIQTDKNKNESTKHIVSASSPLRICLDVGSRLVDENEALNGA